MSQAYHEAMHELQIYPSPCASASKDDPLSTNDSSYPAHVPVLVSQPPFQMQYSRQPSFIIAEHDSATAIDIPFQDHQNADEQSLKYINQLTEFHNQNRKPFVHSSGDGKSPVNFYRLKEAVETKGGFEKVCKDGEWAQIAREIGHVRRTLSVSLKKVYQLWIQPYEEWLKSTKPTEQPAEGQSVYQASLPLTGQKAQYDPLASCAPVLLTFY